MKKRHAGPPTKKTPELVKIICDELKDGVFFKYACKIAGITEQTGIDWKNNDPVFLSQVEAARTIGIKRLQMAALSQGSAWKVLKNVARGDFTDEETVNINDTKAPDLSQVPKEELLARLRRKQ